MSTVFPDDAEARRLLVGPDSVAWRYGSDPRMYFAMLYPLLLQVADPTVGAGVRDYSDFERRPWDRLVTTLDYVTLLIYGGEDAIAAGRRLRGLHKGFKGVREDGKPYYALEPGAYAWVHATLIDTYIRAHEHFGRPMRPSEREQFYREYRGLGRLVGVRERDLPPAYAEFRRYFDEYADTHLTRTVAVDRVLRTITNPARPPIPLPDTLWRLARLPARKAIWVGGIGMLGPNLRERLDITWTARDEQQFARLGALSRALTPLMPGPVRTVGPMQLRMRRRAIAHGPLGDLGGHPPGDAHDHRVAA
jgi:uncharacterized protein (DUF2236 family)